MAAANSGALSTLRLQKRYTRGVHATVWTSGMARTGSIHSQSATPLTPEGPHGRMAASR